LRRRDLDFKTLSKAPIKEALIGMRIQPVAVPALGSLEQGFRALPDDYQTRREPVTLSQTQVKLQPSVPPAVSVDQRQLGWRFGTKSGKYAVQTRVDCFIFSHLAPYTAWPEFSDEALKIWRVFSDIYKPEAVQAVSIRNINEVSISPGENVGRYLRFYINVPPGVPQEFQNYFARIELRYSKDSVAILQSGLLPPLQERHRLLLDIELVTTITPKDEEELWSAIQNLREPKNQIFFSCITEEWEAKLR
jgi:uncharacterized protein (TIGR04255 family)